MNTYKKLMTVLVATMLIIYTGILVALSVMYIETESFIEELDKRYEEQEELYEKYAAAQKELEESKESAEPKVTEFRYHVVTAPIYNLPLSVELQKYTYAVCDSYGMADKYELVLALMWQESNYVADTISSTDDYGLMQINKINHESLSKTLYVDDFLNPEQNIHAGIYIMCNLLSRYNGDEHKALMAYNLGPSGAAALWKNNIYSTPYSRGVLEKLDKLNSYYESN